MFGDQEHYFTNLWNVFLVYFCFATVQILPDGSLCLLLHSWDRFWNKLSTLHVLSFSTLQRTAIFREDVREDRFTCCAWGQVVKSVKSYLSIIPGPRLVAGVSLVIFKRPETHGSVTSSSFPLPQRLFTATHHSKCYWGWRGRHHQKEELLLIRAVIWWFPEIVWIVVLLCQNWFPWLSLANCFSPSLLLMCVSLKTSCVSWDLVLLRTRDVIRLKRERDFSFSWNLPVETHTELLKLCIVNLGYETVATVLNVAEKKE